jgi:hypothetical protein
MKRIDAALNRCFSRLLSVTTDDAPTAVSLEELRPEIFNEMQHRGAPLPVEFRIGILAHMLHR